MKAKKLIQEIKQIAENHYKNWDEDFDNSLGLRVPDNCRYWFEEEDKEYK